MLNFLAVLFLILVALGGAWYGSWHMVRRRVSDGARHTLLIRNICPKCGYSLQGLKTFTCPECGANSQAWAMRDNHMKAPHKSNLVIVFLLGLLAIVGLATTGHVKEVFIFVLVLGAPILALMPCGILIWRAWNMSSATRRGVLLLGASAVVAQVLAFMILYLWKPLEGAGYEAVIAILIVPIPLCAMTAAVGALVGGLLIKAGCFDRFLGYRRS